LLLPEVLSDEDAPALGGAAGAAGATVCAGAFEDCPRLEFGGRLPFLDCEFSPDGVTTVGGPAGATVCSGAFEDCPRLALGGRLLFLGWAFSPDGVVTVGGADGATVCAGALDDCPRLALGGRLLFLGWALSPDGVTTVGGVAGATVCLWEDIWPRFPLCPSGSLFDALLGPPLSDECLLIGGVAGA
jgi:hypothetical protein